MSEPGQGRGGAFYEDEDLLSQYLVHRHAAVTSPNLVMETPAFMDEVGDLSGLRILDVGCGDGTFARECLTAECASYLGIDGSAAMIERARSRVEDDRVRFDHGDIEDMRVSPASFDLVVSRMALHYVKDLPPVLKKAKAALVDGGSLVFSVVHPVVTASVTLSGGRRTTQIVDDYFRPGDRNRDWFGKKIVWQHRTIETYVQAILDAGFSLQALRECGPVENLFHGNTAEFTRRQRVPLFLLLGAQT